MQRAEAQHPQPTPTRQPSEKTTARKNNSPKRSIHGRDSACIRWKSVPASRQGGLCRDAATAAASA
eukprot:14102656-Alexandrium_andersonii.AAC.1